MKQKYLPVLLGLALSCPAFSKTVPTNAAADLVLGQADFVSSAPKLASSFSLASPLAIAIDPISRKVFVTDNGHNRVLRFASLTSLTNGAGAEAVFGQDRFSTSTSASPDFQMNNPFGIFFDRLGRLWVADAGNNRVIMFEAASYRDTKPFPDKVFGQSIFTTITPGTTSQKMSTPTSLWVDNSDTLWVADYGNNRVLRFNEVSNQPNGAVADGVLGQPNFTSSSSGSGSSGFNQPQSVAVTPSGTVFIALPIQNRVLRFDNAASLGNGAGASAVIGQPDFVTTTSGTSATKLAAAYGLSISSDDTLWVCDYSNNRLLRFDKASTKATGAAADGVVGQSDFTTSLAGVTNRKLNGPFLQPFVDFNSALWVPDYINNRVLRFPADGTKPLISITSTVPKSTSAASVTIKGKASDASGISSVKYKIGSGALKTATGTTSWQFNATLAKGDNTVTIYSVDNATNQSVSKVIKIKRSSGVAPFSIASAE